MFDLLMRILYTILVLNLDLTSTISSYKLQPLVDVKGNDAIRQIRLLYDIYGTDDNDDDVDVDVDAIDHNHDLVSDQRYHQHYHHQNNHHHQSDTPVLSQNSFPTKLVSIKNLSKWIPKTFSTSSSVTPTSLYDHQTNFISSSSNKINNLIANNNKPLLSGSTTSAAMAEPKQQQQSSNWILEQHSEIDDHFGPNSHQQKTTLSKPFAAMSFHGGINPFLSNHYHQEHLNFIDEYQRRAIVSQYPSIENNLKFFYKKSIKFSLERSTTISISVSLPANIRGRQWLLGYHREEFPMPSCRLCTNQKQSYTVPVTLFLPDDGWCPEGSVQTVWKIEAIDEDRLQKLNRSNSNRTISSTFLLDQSDMILAYGYDERKQLFIKNRPDSTHCKDIHEAIVV
ncbi:hypothetical protein SSS_05368 [Sarcoptes scabiei]|uniref:Uncharacterized protein n=1 Tax=Sarcoptes scabiei TaxID=52283 RepID=A0A834RKH0_SARSC|nr:hypothetical protein SSS_05368 [Sarcoptes scabiei]